MLSDPNKLSQFWQELKRRRVIHVIIVYSTAAFVIIELVGNVYETLNLPDWTPALTLIILAIGFPIALIFSWIFDVTSEGLEKTKPVAQVRIGDKQTTPWRWKISTYISVLIIIAFVAFYIINSIRRSSDILRLEKSIAVLPFENWSHSKEFSHLGNAIANEIITELYKIKEFRVLSHTSTLQYNQKNKTIPVIGEELGVNFIITGVVERQENFVNIHVQVIQAKNEEHIWADEFYGEWQDIFQIQDEIAIKAAKELKTVLTDNELESIENRPTENLDAYNFYLRGNDYYWRSDEEKDYSMAQTMYEKAIEIDSLFTLAYTMLANVHLDHYWFHYDRSSERLQKSKEAIDVAFRIDPNREETYISLGNYYYMGFLDYPNALKQINTALELNPNNADCIYLRASVYRRMGNWSNAESSYEKAFLLDPGLQLIAFNAAETFFLTGKYDKALNYIDQAIRLRPDFSRAYRQKIDILLKRDGNTINAKKTLNEAMLNVNPSSYHLMIEIVALLSTFEGKYQEALDYLNTTNFEAVQPQFYYYPKPLYYAIIYDLMREPDKAAYYYNLAKMLLEVRIVDYPEDTRLISTLGISYAGLGQKEKAISYGKKAVELLPISKEAYRGVYRLGDLTRIYVMVGEYKLALENIEYLLSIPGVLSPGLLQLDPVWKPLWDNPEFIRLIEKYNHG